MVSVLSNEDLQLIHTVDFPDVIKGKSSINLFNRNEMSTFYVLQTIRHLDGKISKTWLFSLKSFLPVAKQCVNILGRIRPGVSKKSGWGLAERDQASGGIIRKEDKGCMAN